MRRLLTALTLVGLLGAPAAARDAGAPAPQRLVDLRERIPDAVLDLRYATEENFLGKQVYPEGARCLLLEETARRLEEAAAALRKGGYRLRLYDCYRPLAVQWEMWKLMPKPGYVANPKRGSHHNRGAAVDLSLVTKDGLEVEMPTDFDTFSKAAHHGYAGGSEASRRHRELLRKAMENAGFKKNRMEWWHYAIPRAGRHPVLDEPLVAPQK